MSDLFLRLHALFVEGTYGILVPLLVVSVAMSILVLERVRYLFGPAWTLLWPRARAARSKLEAELLAAVDTYIEGPTPASRREILALAGRYEGPYGRFLLHLMRGEGLVASHLRDLQIGEASLLGALDIERGLTLISTLAKVAPLIGLLGTVTGMIQTFSAMMVASTSDPRALSSGVSIALIATEVGLFVALPGVLSMTWLSRRAQALEEELNLLGVRLRQAGPEPGEEVLA